MHEIKNLHNYLAPLPDTLREKIESLCIIRKVGKNEPVYQMGSTANEMYQVISGVIRLSNFSLDGKEMTMGTFYEGDCFGETGLIDGSPRMSCSIAMEQSTLRVMSAQVFHQVYNQHPEFVKAINLVYCHRIRLLYGLAEDSNALNLHERLARTLLRLSHAPSRKFEQNGDNRPVITTSQEELGCMLGASRQSINKELKVLEEYGMISLSYGKILITDIDAIRARYENLIGTEQVSPRYDP